MPLFPYMVIQLSGLSMALLWAAMDSSLSQGPLLWRHNDMTVKPGLYSMRAYTRAYADCRRSCLYFCRRLRPAHTRVYARIRRQSSNMLNFQGQRRPAQAFQQPRKRSKVTQGRRVVLHRDVRGRIPTHTLACLYFYPRHNLCYAVATHRQPHAWTSAPAAGAYARMEYKPGFFVSRDTRGRERDTRQHLDNANARRLHR